MLASNNAVSIVYSVSKNVLSNIHFDKGDSGHEWRSQDKIESSLVVRWPLIRHPPLDTVDRVQPTSKSKWVGEPGWQATHHLVSEKEVMFQV